MGYIGIIGYICGVCVYGVRMHKPRKSVYMILMRRSRGTWAIFVLMSNFDTAFGLLSYFFRERPRYIEDHRISICPGEAFMKRHPKLRFSV